MTSLGTKLIIYLEEYNINFENIQILEMYIDDAITIAKIYMNNDDFTRENIEEKYGVCIVNALVKTMIDKETQTKSKNCKSMSQGARTMTFNEIQTRLKSNLIEELPSPFMRMV